MDVGVVFVGPSLAAPRPSVPGLAYAPPAVRGDLLAALDRGHRCIGLIDGELIQRLAVTPAEVREAARRGARLWGASSLGAIRACECPGAIQGVGRVYELFRNETLRAEDEVVGTFDPETNRTLSYPLVTVRESLAWAVRESLLSEAQSAEVLQSVRRLSFDRRQSTAVAAAVMENTSSRHAASAVLNCLRRGLMDPKRADALELIEIMRPHLAAVVTV
jgi:hypothetical protein